MSGAATEKTDSSRAGIEESARELRRGSVAEVMQDISVHMQRFSAYVHGTLKADLDNSPVKGRDLDGAMHCFKAAAGYMDAARSMLRKANGRLESPAETGIRCGRCQQIKPTTRPAFKSGDTWVFGEPARTSASRAQQGAEYLCTDCEPGT